jgi:hypothetical protein
MGTLTLVNPESAPPPVDLITRAKSLTIKTPEQYVQACEDKLALDDMIANRHANHDPVCAKAHEAHKAAVAARSADIAPLEAAKTIYECAINGWRREQERIANEQARLAREEQERIALLDRENEIEAAEADSATVEEVAAIIDRPVYVPPAIARPAATMVPKVPGIRKKPDNWKAILDPADAGAKLKLIKYVAANPQFQHLLILDSQAANQLAKALKLTMALPGVKVYNDQQ